MYKCLVVGTDGSSTAGKAVETAADLARQWGAVLHTVTAFHASGGGMGQAAGAAMAGDAGAGLHREAANEVGHKGAETWAKGVTVEHHVVSGSAADAILDTASEVGADLIVVGSKGMHGARRVLGSVPNSVAHGATCGVLIVKTD